MPLETEPGKADPSTIPHICDMFADRRTVIDITRL